MPMVLNVEDTYEARAQLEPERAESTVLSARLTMQCRPRLQDDRSCSVG